MKYSMFNTEIQKFNSDQNFKGEFNLLRPENFYQPYAGLPKQRNESSPLKNSAQIGLRIITKIYNSSNVLYVEFISESRCLLDYDEPENEEQIFAEVAEKAISEHLKLFTEQLKKINYSHSGFQVLTDVVDISLKETPFDRFKQTPTFQLPFLI